MDKFDIEINSDGIDFKYRVNGILLKENKILTIRMEHNDFFCLPGGHVNLGEDSKKAIIREMKEETGYDVEINKLIFLVENFFMRNSGEKIHEISLYYLLDTKEPIKNSFNDYTVREIDKGKEFNHFFRWIDLKNIETINFKPKEIIESLKEKSFSFKHIIIK